jgi:hypothetical protein
VVDTAHKFEQFKDGEVDAARQEELREWTLQNPNADEATKLKQAAVINARYEKQYGLTSSKRALEIENFKISASLPGAKYKDFERDYVIQRGEILSNSEMEPEEKAEKLKVLNDTYLETGLKQFGDNEEQQAAIYRTVVEGRNENQERITRTVRKNLRKMGPRINEEIEAVISEIGTGNHLPMNRSELAKIISERAGVPEEMQTELFLEQFNLFYKEKIDQHYGKVDAAFKKRVKDANAEETAMTQAALYNSQVFDQNMSGDYYAAVAAQVVDGGADQSQKSFNSAIVFMAEQYATKYTKGPRAAEDAWRDEALAQAEQFGLDPDSEIVTAMLTEAKKGLGSHGFSAADRALERGDVRKNLEVAIAADDPKDRWAAQTLSTEEIFNWATSYAIGKGTERLSQHPEFRNMDSQDLGHIATDAGDIIMRARLSHSRNPQGMPFAAHLARETAGVGADVRKAVGIMTAADPAAETFLDDMSNDLKRLRNSEVLHVEQVKDMRRRATAMGMTFDDSGKLKYDSNPSHDGAQRAAENKNGSLWAERSRINGVDVPDFSESLVVQGADVEKLGRLMLSDPEFIGQLEKENGSYEDKARRVLERMSQAMGFGNGFNAGSSDPEIVRAVQFLQKEVFGSQILEQIRAAQNETPPNNKRVGELVDELNRKSEGAWSGLAHLSTNNKIRGTNTGSIINEKGNVVVTGVGGVDENDAKFFSSIKTNKNSPAVREFMLMFPDLKSASEIVQMAKTYGFTYDAGSETLQRANKLNDMQEPVISISGHHNSGGRAVSIHGEFLKDLQSEQAALQNSLDATGDQNGNPALVQLNEFYTALLNSNGSAAELAAHSNILSMLKRRTVDDPEGQVDQIDGPRLAAVQAILTDKSFYKTLEEKYPLPADRNRAIAIIAQNTTLTDGGYVAVIPIGTDGVEALEAGKEFQLNTFGRNYRPGTAGKYRSSYGGRNAVSINLALAYANAGVGSAGPIPSPVWKEDEPQQAPDDFKLDINQLRKDFDAMNN